MRLYGINVRGKKHDWVFTVPGKPEWVADWLADGLDADEVVNIIPLWAAALGLTRIWCWLQDRGFI